MKHLQFQTETACCPGMKRNPYYGKASRNRNIGANEKIVKASKRSAENNRTSQQTHWKQKIMR